MATDLDELQIVITSNSNEASEALDKLVKGLENLNAALGNLDASKVNSFANSMSKIANIGANTDTTGEAIKGLAKNLADSFGIKTKKGIDDITVSMLALYRASRNVDLNGSMENNNVFEHSIDNLKKAIEANYQYRQSVDETNKKIADFVKAQNKSGNKIAMGEIAAELGEDFKAVSKILGSSFKNTLKDDQATPLAAFLTDMNEVLNTDFKTDTLVDLQESIERIKNAIIDSKPVVYNYGEAISNGLLKGEEAGMAALEVVDKLFALIKEQDKYGASAGLSGLVAAMEAISNANIPDMSGFAEVAKFAQNMSSNVPKATPEINEVSKAIDNVAASADKATESVKNLSTALILISDRTDLALIDPTSLERSLAVMKEMSNFQPPDFSTNLEYFNEYAQTYERKLGNILRLENNQKLIEDKYYEPIDTTGEFVDETAESFTKVKDAFNDLNDAVNSFNQGANQGTSQAFDNIAQSANKATADIEDFLKAMQQYKKIISEMETGKIDFDKAAYDEAVKGYHSAAQAVKEYKDSLLGLNKTPKDAAPKEVVPKEAVADVSENLKTISEGFEGLEKTFDSLGDKGIALFKKILTPIKMASSEYIEKFKGMSNAVANFQKDFKVHMKKVSDFWKRTMRTFTFMIVRTAFTAVLKEIDTAVQSLAMYSNAMGTAFNSDISLMVADFQYLGRSIVSIFAPLLSYIAPIIDAIVDKIATLLSYIGMLIAALGGSSSFTKAKKNVSNYAESLDKASKSAKNLTMGIDELNILNDSKGGSAKPYDGWEDAWEDVKIPDWIKNLADWFKKLWDDIFGPLKEAWNRAKQYLLDGFKTLRNSLKNLFMDIGRDFIEVWKQEKTIRMFEQILRIVGDLLRVVRNLANAFDKAWNYNRTGFKILQNIRDIMAILIDHARNISYYMIGWADNIDFKPLLTKFEKLTASFKGLADFIGGVVEDIFTQGILKYIKWMIEDGIPHLQNTIAETLALFNGAKIRAELQPVWDAVADLLANIHTGVSNAIGNLGRELASFANSSEFSKFLENIVNLSRQITAERVEKVLTGLGKGIINIGKAVVKFVNSKTFQDFIEFLVEKLDKTSADDIAKGLERLATAISVFKFGAFASSKLSGLFKFFSMLFAMKNLKDIAAGLNGVAKGTTAISKSVSGVGALYNPLSRVTGLFPSLISNLNTTIGAFKNLSTLGIKGIIEGIGLSINEFAASLSPLTVIIGSITTAFLEWKGVTKSASDLAHALNGDGEHSVGGSILGIVGKIGLASAAFTALLGFPGGLIAGLAVGAVAAIKGIKDAVEQINFDRIGDAITTQGEMTLAEVQQWYDKSTEIVNTNIAKWKDAERNLTQDRGDIAEYSKEIQNFSTVFENAGNITMGMADSILGKYEDLGSAIENYIDQSTDALVTNILAQRAFLEAQGIDVTQMITDIYTAADEEKTAVSGAVDSIKDAVKGLDGLTKGSQEYEEQMKKVSDAVIASGEVFDKYFDQFNDIDTSDAVREIQQLGNSLDLSQYKGDPDAALKAISEQVDLVKTTYQTKMNELKTEADRLKGEVEMMPNVTDEQKEAFNLSIDHAYQQAGEKLATASNQVLALYSQNLSKQMATVAENAAADWDAGLVSTFLQPYSNKEEYILYQMYQHNNKLVEQGVGQSLKDAYAEIPNNVSEDVVTAMSNIIEQQEGAYRSALQDGSFYDDNYNMLTNVLGAVNDLDYQTPADTYANKNYNAIYQAMQGCDYSSLGALWNSETGGALISNSQIFEDSNRLAANEGAAAFSDSYVNFLKDNTSTIDTLGKLGDTYGGSIVEGLNKSIEEQASTSEAPITNWFSGISKFIHDNPFMPFGSPNKKTYEYGQDIVTGFNEGVTKSASTSVVPINTWMTSVNNTIQKALTKWEPEILTPLENNILNHWNVFLSWWDSSISDWWNSHVVVWFDSGKWRDQFEPILDVAKEVFQGIREAINTEMETAMTSVENACKSMKEYFAEMMQAINDMIDSLGKLEQTKSSNPLNPGTPGKYATGGFPTQGTLFYAGEKGAEFVSNVGGRTGVVSNGEITGIADAVYATGNTESALLAQLVAVGQALLNKDPVILGDKELAIAVNRGKSQMGMSIIT